MAYWHDGRLAWWLMGVKISHKHRTIVILESLSWLKTYCQLSGERQLKRGRTFLTICTPLSSGQIWMVPRTSSSCTGRWCSHTRLTTRLRCGPSLQRIWSPPGSRSFSPWREQLRRRETIFRQWIESCLNQNIFKWISSRLELHIYHMRFCGDISFNIPVSTTMKLSTSMKCPSTHSMPQLKTRRQDLVQKFFTLKGENKLRRLRNSKIVDDYLNWKVLQYERFYLHFMENLFILKGFLDE